MERSISKEERKKNKRDWHKEVGRRWGGLFAHWCNDWDGMAVDEFTPEFSCCLETWKGWRGFLFPFVRRLNIWYWLWRSR